MKETKEIGTEDKIKAVAFLVVFVFLILWITGVFSSSDEPDYPNYTQEQQDSIRKQKKIESLFTYDRHLPSIALIQQRMNDPKSFDFISSRHWPLDSAGCVGVLTVYTGKNAYGGVIKQSCITYIDSTGAVFEVQFQ